MFQNHRRYFTIIRGNDTFIWPLVIRNSVEDRKSNEYSVSVSSLLSFTLSPPSEPVPDELPLPLPDGPVEEKHTRTTCQWMVAPDELG